MTQNDALTAAADAENTAVFTYGLLTAFTTGDVRQTVADHISEHRERRDQVNVLLLEAGQPERTSAAGYRMPEPVTDQTGAAKAALVAERGCETAYLALLEQADDSRVRRLGVDGLTDSALRAGYWRGIADVAPRTEAFPGR